MSESYYLSSPQRVNFFDGKEIDLICGSDHNLALTSEGLFGWSVNNYGEINLIENEDLSKYLPQKISFFNDKKINFICCADQHCLALTSEGLFGWGNDKYIAQHLNIQVKGYLHIPQRLTFFDEIEIQLICCGSAHSLASTSEGLFGWGQNYSGQLGLGFNSPIRYSQEESYVAFPKRISFFNQKEIDLMCCGSAHCLVLTPEGLFSWGENYSGELGLGYANPMECRPQKVSFFEDKEIDFICCADQHCLALTSEGLFSWGKNYSGELGLGETRIELKKGLPQKIEFFNEKVIIEVTCGPGYCLALTSEGLFGWGNNFQGQLGTQSNVESNSPQIIPFFTKTLSYSQLSFKYLNSFFSSFFLRFFF